MTAETQIMELSSLTPLEILETVEKLLEQNHFQRFTLLIQRTPKEKKMTDSLGLPLRKQKSKFSVFSTNKYDSDYNYKLPVPLTEHLAQSDDLENIVTQGLRFYYQGQYDTALQLFQQQERQLLQSLKEGISSVKEYHDICFRIGNCNYRLKNYEKAIEYFSKQFVAEEAKQRGQKYNNLGSCYAHIDQPRLSLSSYAEALKIYSDFPQVDCSNLLNNLGMLYAQSSMFQTAEKYFLQSIEQRKSKSPQSSGFLYSSYLQLGNCRKHSKKYVEAIASLQLALNFAERGFGDQAETLLQIASIYEKCQKWTEALDCYEKLSQKSEQKGFLYERAAQIHRHMGRQSDYDRFIKKAYEQYLLENNQPKLTELQSIVTRLTKK